MAEQMQYTPGPWRWRKQSGDDPHAFVFAGDYADEGEPDLYCEVISGNPDADARRIVACVNACEGIPTDALESGVVRELIEAAESALFALENCGPERLLDDFEMDAIERLQTVLAKVRGEA